MSGRLGRLIYALVAGVALVFGSFAVALIALEVGLRIWDGKPFAPINFVDLEVNSIVNPNNVLARFDDRLGWAQVANRSWQGIYTFGDEGIRMSTPQTGPLQQGAILLVGDSFGGGSEVNDADAWPARLENMVGTRVLNAAVGGYGVDQTVLHAEDLVQRLKPRMLLVETNLAFGISLNRMSIYSGAPKPYFMPEDGKLTLMNEPVPRGVSHSIDIGWERSVTHVDYSARVQTVHKESNPLYYSLIERFEGLTGCPVLINTSFNVRSEPIVCTPEDAFRCFMGTELDLLVVGNAVLHKQDQDPALKVVYTDKFELD
jgi:hypothetical protein